MNGDYNLLGNVHWLEPFSSPAAPDRNYNLLGNVHWLELNRCFRCLCHYYNLLGNVHWLQRAFADIFNHRYNTDAIFIRPHHAHCYPHFPA